MKTGKKIKLQIPDPVLEKLNRLFLSWRVGPEDWALATEPALQRQGYAIYDDKNPYEIDLWVDSAKLPWKAEPGWMTIPPKGSRQLKQLERFVKISGYSLHMVPSPFAGFTLRQTARAAYYELPNGRRIRMLTPEIYIEQLTCLVTHPVTKTAFWFRLPKLARRAELIKQEALRWKRSNVVKACDDFLKLAKRLQKKKPAKKNEPPVFEAGIVRGLGIGRGKVRGRVRIILHARDFGKMRQGEVLVTYDTNPEFILILRKMKAVVTDVGGISCHASVIAREFGVPAVVGTEFATKVLKNDDMVEVDANKGIVRKI